MANINETNAGVWGSSIAAGSGLISGLIGTIASSIMANKQMDFAKEMQEQQIVANKELNEQNIEFANLQYERSTASNQINELMKAGLSEQQAKMAVLGQSGAAYTPPVLSSSMEGVDPSMALGAMANQANAVNTGVSSALDSVSTLLQGSITGDGGAIGTMMTADIQSRIMSHYNELPSWARTLYGFMQYSNSAAAPDWCRDLLNSKKWKSAITSQPGMRSLKAFFQSSYELATGDAHLDGLVLQNQREKVQINIDQVNLDQVSLDYTRAATEWAYDSPNMATFSAAKYQNAVNMINKLSLENEYLSNPKYRQQAIVRACTDMDNQVLYVTALRYIYEKRTDWLSDPNNAQLIAIFDSFNGAGVTSTEAGTILAALEASGIPLTTNVRSFVESVKKAVPSVPDVVNTVAETVEAAEEKILEMRPRLNAYFNDLKNKTADHFSERHELMKWLDSPDAKKVPWRIRFKLYSELFFSLGLSGMDEAASLK